MTLANLSITAVELLAQVPNPGVRTPEGLEGPRDLMLGMLKWGGLAIAAGSIIYTGIKLTVASKSGHGTTTAADAVSEVPYKIVGVLLVSGLGSGVLGMFL